MNRSKNLSEFFENFVRGITPKLSRMPTKTVIVFSDRKSKRAEMDSVMRRVAEESKRVVQKNRSPKKKEKDGQADD